jgi:hypothetical protein
VWSADYSESFDLLKRKLVETPILRFPESSNKIHVHVDASNVTDRAMLAQPRDELVNHPNKYSS